MLTTGLMGIEDNVKRRAQRDLGLLVIVLAAVLLYALFKALFGE